tara:strand:+ start:693 stop:956 length:264 start_codon:yes stop_codon:yes gene_type:complete
MLELTDKGRARLEEIKSVRASDPPGTLYGLNDQLEFGYLQRIETGLGVQEEVPDRFGDFGRTSRRGSKLLLQYLLNLHARGLVARVD